MSNSVWNADLGNGKYKNPILYTDYSDPDAIRVGDDYYMIASSFCNAPAIPILHSKDLVNWKVINYVMDKIPEERYKNPIHGCGVWAPAIRYHEETFYVCFPMPDEGIYMSTAKNPFGKWSEPINIRPGAGWIDPCPFWDDDGRAYLVAGVAKSRIGYKSVLHMVEMKPDGTRLLGEEVKIFDGNENDQITIEGPKMYKRNGYYYIFAPAGGVKTGWQTVLRSTSPFGPYEYKVVMRQGTSQINGPHQGAWVDTKTGQDWFIHFQDVYGAGRITHLQPMTWKNDWPIIGIARCGNDYGEPVIEYEKPDVGEVYEITEPDTSDEFEKSTLGLQWQWNANYEKSWYSIDTDKQVLRLNAVAKGDKTNISDLSNLLLQKWPAPEFVCDTKMNFSNLSNADVSGIVSMGMKFCALAVKKEDDRLSIVLYEGNQKFTGENITTTQQERFIEAIQVSEVYFKYIVRRNGIRAKAETPDAPLEKIELYYSLDGQNYKLAHIMDSMAGRWVGIKNGVFSFSNSKEQGGYSEIEYFRYS